MKEIGRSSQRVVWMTGASVGPGGKSAHSYSVTDL